MIGYLSEMGEAQSYGEGITANSWQEMRAWSDLMGITLSPGEAKAIRALSSAYVSEYYRSDGKDCAAPGIKLPEAEVVESKIMKLFAMLRK